MTTNPDVDTKEVDAFFLKWKLCDGRYVRWHVVITTILGGVVLIVSIAFAGGRWGKGMESEIAIINGRCDRIERTVRSIDTIDINVKKLLKEIEHANAR